MTSNATQEAGAAEAPTKGKTKVAKVAKEAKARGPRTNTLWFTLQQCFSKNQKRETILEIIKEKHPDSDFNVRPKLHYSYYRAKFNGQAKKAGNPMTNSVAWPSERKVRAPKENGAKKASGKVKQVEQAEEAAA